MQKLPLTFLLVATMTLQMEASTEGDYPKKASCDEAFQKYMQLFHLNNTQEQKARLDKLRKHMAK
jgi:hypothetical protein